MFLAEGGNELAVLYSSLYLTLPLTIALSRSPTHHHWSELMKYAHIYWLGQIISQLFRGYWVNGNLFSGHIIAEVMQFDVKMLGTWTESVGRSYF